MKKLASLPSNLILSITKTSKARSPISISFYLFIPIYWKGFLKPGLNDQTTVANFGILDQIAALQWIKENIEAFGGDRNSVTLLGYDTGAICTNFLMISPIARGLFHRAILMSGSALSDWALNYNPQHITMQVAKKLNCPIEDSKLGECLRQRPYQEIMNVTVTAPEFLTIYGPIVDGLVVPSDPNEVMENSDSFSRFDLLFGMTEIESFNILGRDATANGLPQVDRDHNIRRYLINRFDKRPEIAFLSTLKEYTNTFMKSKPVSHLDHRDMLLEILSDARVTAPMSKSTENFQYVFSLNFSFVFSSNWNLPVTVQSEMLHVRFRTQQ